MWKFALPLDHGADPFKDKKSATFIFGLYVLFSLMLTKGKDKVSDKVTGIIAKGSLENQPDFDISFLKVADK